jgi:hypothetical protein
MELIMKILPGIFAFMFFFVVVVGFDFIVFIIKKAPKQSNFSKVYWIMAFWYSVILITVYFQYHNIKFIK